MKNYIKAAMDTLEALDFRLDHEDRKIRTDRFVFTHANAPGERLTLNFRMSELAARTVVQKARQIVGLASTETGRAKRETKASHRRKVETATERRARAAAVAAAEARQARRQAERLVDAVSARRDELDRLLRGGGTTGGAAAIPVGALLTPEQVADITGLTDKAVKRAIDSERLVAVMTRDGVRIPGHAVKEWMAAS